MEDKSRVCKICNRQFANGKAMGGHMRSHLAKLPLPVTKNIHIKPPSKPLEKTAPADDAITPPQSPPSITSATSQHALSSPKERSPDDSKHTSPIAAAVATAAFDPLHMSVQDRESDTESLKRNPTCKRLKRLAHKMNGEDESVMKKKNTAVVHETEQVSSVSETFSDEDLALCLLMLSGKRKRSVVEDTTGDDFDDNKRRKVVAKVEDEDLYHVDRLSNSSDEEEEDNQLDDDSYVGRKVRGKYRCELCKKVFKSHQALGGHKASHKHKKMVRGREDPEMNDKNNGGGVSYKRVFECEFCGKVFETGQGLGGHKKIHLFYARKYKNVNNDEAPKLDLNLPPAPEDEEEEVMSQVVQS